MIKYLGSKRTLLPSILDRVSRVRGATSVIDLFSGTSRVGHALKRAGYRVLANDHNAYAHAIATCYVQADREDVHERAERLIAHLNGLPGRAGYVTETFCRQSRYFHPRNGERIDSIRSEIEARELEPELRAVAIVSLMEAADRVDSTTGVQMAYLKKWAPRAHNDLELRVPDVVERVRHGRCEAHQLDAVEAARTLRADVAYIDPPYNQHSYLGNYHVWETLTRWDQPEVYGTACKRVDCRERRSPFNSRRQIHDAMLSVIDSIDARVLIVSFNNEGYINPDRMREMLASRGNVEVVEREYPRYVGAKIGIHNPDGRKVGRVGHTKNRELLFVAGCMQL